MNKIGSVPKCVPDGSYVATWSGWKLNLNGFPVFLNFGIPGTVTKTFIVRKGFVYE